MMKIHILLDERTYSSKPTDIKSINNRITNYPVETTIQEFAAAIVAPNSRTWIPAILAGKRKNENWKHQQIFALDFDSGITFESVLNRLTEYGLDCTFAYSTFSSSLELPKFRVIWQLDQIVINRNFRNSIQRALMLLFPEADKACKDESRLFYGGIELIYQNFKYYLNLELLETASVLYNTKDAVKPDKEISRVTKKLNLVQNPAVPKNILGIDEKCTKNTRTEKNKATISQRKATQLLDHVDFEELRKKVRILDEFMSGEWIYHPQLFGLATNLQYIEGGQKLYKECLKLNSNYSQDKHNIITYIKKMNYHPKNLENFSPYEEDWQYKNLLEAAKLGRGEVRRREKYKSISLEEAESRLDNALKAALAETENNIWIIKKATGLGGTEKLTNCEAVTIAFPNHDLKAEVSHRFKVKHLVTPRLPESLDNQVKEKIEYYYAVGANSKAFEILKKESENNLEIQEYLKHTIESFKSEKTVLTTHTKSLFVKFNSNTIIFDEDPLSNILEINTCTLNDLNRLANSTTNFADKDNIRKFVEIITNGLEKTIKSTKEILINDLAEIESIVLNNKVYDSSIIKFLNSDYYCIDSSDSSTIYFVKQNHLPVNKKIIILSATANEKIYKMLYGDRVKFININNVELTGKIIQDTEYSVSRDSLKRENVYKSVLDKVKNLPVITFAGYKEIFSNPVDEMHFGKTTGFDTLKGKDIAVVGTPHIKIVTYLLYAKALGIEIEARDFNITQKRVRHNGFEFRFNTFGKTDLQLIQFHLIEEQLKQAVGRARALREPAKVLLLSNYPLSEAYQVPLNQFVNQDELRIKKNTIADITKSPEINQTDKSVSDNDRNVKLELNDKDKIDCIFEVQVA